MSYSLPKKTIWVVTYNFGQVKAGPVLRFIRYVPFFRERGYELFFVTKHRDGSPGFRMSEDGIISYHIACNSLIELTSKSLTIIQKFDNPPCYLLFFSLHFLNYWDLRKIVKRGIKCMYVSTMQLSLDFNQNTGKQRSFVKKRILSFILRNLYSLMDDIVSSTDELKQDFIDLNIAGNKLRTIYNGVDTEKFRPPEPEEKNQYRMKLGLPADKFIFLYVGLFVDRKGVDDLIKTFIEMSELGKGFVLLMVGEEKATMENSSGFDLEWPNLKKRGFEEGWLMVHPFSVNIQDYFGASDAFVFMSKLEGMPNVILEAMSSGLPVLTTEFEGFSNEYGVEKVHYLLLSRNHHYDACTLSELMVNEILRRDISLNSRERVVTCFDVKHSVDKYCQIFGANASLINH